MQQNPGKPKVYSSKALHLKASICRSQCLPFFLHKNKPRASSKSSQSLSLWPSPSELNDHDKGCHRRQALTVTSWLHLLIWLLVSGFLCRSRSLQLVEARIESIVPHMVEVDSAQHGDGPHKWDLHAEHWFQAHGLAHVESIAHHGQHGERSRAQDPSNRGVGFGQCSSQNEPSNSEQRLSGTSFAQLH